MLSREICVSRILWIHLCQYWRTLLSTGVAAVEASRRGQELEDLQSIWQFWHLGLTSFTCGLYLISVHHLRVKLYGNRVDAFWTPPSCPRHGSAGPPLDAGSRFHSELCTALPPVPPPTRAQPRPPTRTTAPQEDAVQKCAKFRQSPRNWHTRAAATWCCRETGVSRGDGGWVQSCKDGDEMCDGEEIASWTLDIRASNEGYP